VFTVLLITVLLITAPLLHASTASWYGEEHRGLPMANRQPFDPDALTCASWFHPLGTRLTITRADGLPGSVEVVVTDRGPHRRLVRQGRLVDLSRAAFARIEGLEMGLVEVRISPARGTRARTGATEKRPDAKPPVASLRTIPQLAQAWPGSRMAGAMPPNPVNQPAAQLTLRGEFEMPTQ
jgi:rare lipoprotein A